ncbi:MAG: bifunctional N-acetylglucosamine-1-phosphate uridyltransferase/glucosamine-1-phosphate acetyltransferase [Desulfobulbaceae bacterium]|uniref:Bifunctional N-acetylglucosamine-1-phosphate uridyltransferase/glucosamine-1-phosphate acetyltransferase n=1 Tax=Candidatus Desulfatifera sulfidica TaxID=2841691 RepID=A0A8J6N8S2_9BACT|nr:bifunctional N-acetylglucosamine-1-phosphate uridyltransferase/glucosamine-1-phosphate acetyltransferase [Candidatus Desulfatifera sulfidica]
MTQPTPLSVIILAAGKGTRMKSTRAKVLHEVFFEPMLHHVLKTVAPLQPQQSLVVVGHQRDDVTNSIKRFRAETVLQEEQLGTGHAVLCCQQTLSDPAATLLILCGDTPLLRSETLRDMLEYHQTRRSQLTVMTTLLDNPSNYGRIISDADEKVRAIVEEKDADSEQKKIREINAGIYCVQAGFLFNALSRVGTDNAQKEVYLTDIVAIATQNNIAVERYLNPVATDVLGVNSRVELAEAHQELQLRRNRDLMLHGVTLHSPSNTAIAAGVSIGQDTIIEPGVRITGSSRVGQNCLIQAGAILHDCLLGDGVRIAPYSCLTQKEMTSSTSVPPHTRDSVP